MAEDYLYVGPSGLTLDRQAILAIIGSRRDAASTPRRLGLVQQRIDGLLQRVAADVPIADHALAIEDEDGRDGPDLPVLGELGVPTAGAGPPVGPGQLLPGEEVPERLDLVVDADPDELERLALGGMKPGRN
jgi:hypothetical protein